MADHKVKKEEYKNQAKDDAYKAASHASDFVGEAGGYATEAIKEAGEKIAKKIYKKGEQVGANVSENIVTATEYLKEGAEDATDYVKGKVQGAGDRISENVVTATDYLKEGVEEAKQYAQEKVEQAKDFVIDVEEGVECKGKDLSSKLKCKANNAYDYLFSGYVRHLSEFMDNASRKYNRLVSYAHKPAKPIKEKNDEYQILENLKRLVGDEGLEKPELKKAIDTILNNARITKNKAESAFSDAADKIKDTLHDGYKKITSDDGKKKPHWNEVNEAFTNTLRHSNTPRGYWRSIYLNLDDKNSPLAEPIRSFGYSPIPTTSFYIGLITLLYAFTKYFNYEWRYGGLVHEKKTTRKSIENKNRRIEVVEKETIDIHVEDKEANGETNHSRSKRDSDDKEIERFNSPYWLLSIISNVVLLELNDYPWFVAHLLFLSTILLSLCTTYIISPSYHRSITYLPYIVLGICSFLNILSGIFGAPVF